MGEIPLGPVKAVCSVGMIPSCNKIYDTAGAPWHKVASKWITKVYVPGLQGSINIENNINDH